MRTSRLGWTLLVVLALSLYAVSGCATNPVTGRSEFSLVSAAQELRIGQESHAAILQEYGAYDDPPLAAYVDSIGQAMARRSHTPSLTWHFTVLDDPVVNAFALPGGYVYVTRGIIAHMNSEAQLAGVLGHEIGHVTARHSAQRITQQQVAGLGLGLATVFVESFRPYSDAAQTGLQLMFLKFGRDDENQADELGVDYSTKSGYDAREIPDTYQTLARVGARSGRSLPSFLSTHPDPGDREIRTRELARAATAGQSDLAIRGAEFFAHVDGVVYGNDPRLGYFDGSLFVHPKLGFEMRFPAGWQSRNSAAAVVAVDANQTAGMQVTLADAKNLSPSDYVRELERTQRIVGAEGRSERFGSYTGWIGRLSIPSQGGGAATLAAAFIRIGEQTIQIVGQARDPRDEDAIFESARSFRDVRDRARLEVTPDRIEVARVRESATLEDILRRNGLEDPQVLEDLAIVNNLQLDQPLARGQRVKLLKRGSR